MRTINLNTASSPQSRGKGTRGRPPHKDGEGNKRQVAQRIALHGGKSDLGADQTTPPLLLSQSYVALLCGKTFIYTVGAVINLPLTLVLPTAYETVNI